jgi:hypothetical protein
MSGSRLIWALISRLRNSPPLTHSIRIASRASGRPRPKGYLPPTGCRGHGGGEHMMAQPGKLWEIPSSPPSAKLLLLLMSYGPSLGTTLSKLQRQGPKHKARPKNFPY